MQFKNQILVDHPFNAARWTGGEITPEIVVLHDTASRLDTGSAARFLRDNEAKVSVHFVVEIDGTVTQQVPIDRRANHAGKSHYHGRDHCNGFSIGIEIVNPGRMTRAGSNARTWFGQLFDIEEHGIQDITTPEHGAGLWMPYPEPQIDAVLELLQALFGASADLKDIVTHWYISPGRKMDTNPLFPLSHIKARVLGRDDPAEDAADGQSTALTDTNQLIQVDAPGDTLNLRRWPSFNPNTIAQIPDQAILPVLRKGTFNGRDWAQVLYGGQTGWIVARYAAEITFETGPKT
ncbi:N-acetylmuramoyl-L-alanine amidase [Halocynthiibacter namhaensis]|uniref:N-acetylmuramoyl-L-alanine amidase n=1 Tax=Halocynthiibacter namhaensis TaxID=1290553 RepID=UPI0005790CE9|nr:N-acetylmuramoyl-L-alanine amidase [Halocynthiibacter namhaensis]